MHVRSVVVTDGKEGLDGLAEADLKGRKVGCHQLGSSVEHRKVFLE